MIRRTLILVLALPALAFAAEPAPGSLPLKTTEAEAVELDDSGEVTGRVQKPGLDAIIVSDPVKPALEPPKRKAVGDGEAALPDEPAR